MKLTDRSAVAATPAATPAATTAATTNVPATAAPEGER